jgi:hypothetical protein
VERSCEDRASYLFKRSNSYIREIGVFGSATRSVWPRVGYKFVSRISVRRREPMPVALMRRVVLGRSVRREEREE